MNSQPVSVKPTKTSSIFKTCLGVFLGLWLFVLSVVLIAWALLMLGAATFAEMLNQYGTL